MLITTLVVLAVLTAALAAAVAFGGPAGLPAKEGVSDALQSVDVSDLPAAEQFVARDGTPLAYRSYQGQGGATLAFVTLVHGSSSRSNSMHVLAKGLALHGFQVHVLDVRGHGLSGTRGQIAYVGQLEDDLEDFLRAVRPAGQRMLVGFSAGGGFVLRVASGAHARMFDAYLLLAPFLSQRASTYRPASGGWASVGVPRMLGLLLLNRVGIARWNHLAVTAFAVSPDAEAYLTSRYSYALAMNFRPRPDYRTDIASAVQPMEVLVGAEDDQFHAQHFAAEFNSPVREIQVSILPGVAHMDLILAPSAVNAAGQALGRLAHRANRPIGQGSRPSST